MSRIEVAADSISARMHGYGVVTEKFHAGTRVFGEMVSTAADTSA